MDEYLQLMRQSPLFYGINEDELYTLLKCCDASQQVYEEGEAILRMGESMERVMLLLRGRALVFRETFWGEKEELMLLEEGQSFGEDYACARTAVLPVGVEALEECEILFLSYQRMITFCSLACSFHTRLIQNLLRLVSERSVNMEDKLEHVSRKTTREKLLSYLSKEAILQGNRSFDISYSRQELADYLCVDRSAMSGELGKLKREGVLDFQKNHFTLFHSQK